MNAMARLRLVLVAMGVALAGAGLTMPGFSSASFTARSVNTGTVTAAPDWTPPAVSVQSPGSPIKDTVTITATALDPDSGVRDVVIQYLPGNASSWVTLCSATSAPYSCAWNTKTVTDGSYDLRAVATDNAGYSTTSDTVRTTVANNLLVVLADPGDEVRGTVPLNASVFNAGAISHTVRVEYSLAGADSWRTICTNLSSPYYCSWLTTGFANDYYDLRAVVTSGGASYYSQVVTDVLVDNLAPTVSMVDPGSPLSGTRTLSAVASDAHSGVAQVVIQYAPTGSSTWAGLCTLSTSPYSCSYDTTELPDGSYSFRAVATDEVGNSTTSSAITNRVVDNTVSAVSMVDPGAYLSGTVNLSAVPSSTAGVTSVRIQYAAGGTTGWTDVCTDPTSPYTCDWNTTLLPNGLYDLRAILLDGAGRETVSAVVTSRRVDNAALRGTDVQTANGGATAGKAEPGDSITFTFSKEINLGSVSAGWSGTALPVTLRLRDGNLFGLGNTGDTLDVQRSGSVVNLGSVNLRQDYIKSGKTSVFNATMTAGSAIVNGVTQTTVTVTLGSLVSGGALRTVSTPAAMVWSPSTAVTDIFGNVSSAVPVTESGTSDREF